MSIKNIFQTFDSRELYLLSKYISNPAQNIEYLQAEMRFRNPFSKKEQQPVNLADIDSEEEQQQQQKLVENPDTTGYALSEYNIPSMPAVANVTASQYFALPDPDVQPAATGQTGRQPAATEQPGRQSIDDKIYSILEKLQKAQVNINAFKNTLIIRDGKIYRQNSADYRQQSADYFEIMDQGNEQYNLLYIKKEKDKEKPVTVKILENVILEKIVRHLATKYQDNDNDNDEKLPSNIIKRLQNKGLYGDASLQEQQPPQPLPQQIPEPISQLPISEQLNMAIMDVLNTKSENIKNQFMGFYKYQPGFNGYNNIEKNGDQYRIKLDWTNTDLPFKLYKGKVLITYFKDINSLVDGLIKILQIKDNNTNPFSSASEY